MFYIWFKTKILFKKNKRIAQFCSFPLFWWAMWVSDHEQFAQFAQRKWAIVSESLRSLTKIERMSDSLIIFSESLFHSFLDKKRGICSEIKWANSQPCYIYVLKQTLRIIKYIRKMMHWCFFLFLWWVFFVNKRAYCWSRFAVRASAST